MMQQRERIGADANLSMLRLEVEEFLYYEADLIDQRQFDKWLQLLADDLRYRMPLARNIAVSEIANEHLSEPLSIAWFDEGKETLAIRVAQINTGVHWAEEPLSRTSHLVTNVRVISARPSVPEAQEVEVACKFLVYRHRNSDTEDTLIGRRVDRLRRSADSWLIFERTIFVNQTVLLANSLSFFV
jgi:3-phenylpropionate/cinnamic acid dioxygenase small subunit